MKIPGIGNMVDPVEKRGGESEGGVSPPSESQTPLRCRSCSSTSCCIASPRPSSYLGDGGPAPPIAPKADVNDHVVEMMDDPSTLWYWQFVYGVATRARARVARTRGNDN